MKVVRLFLISLLVVTTAGCTTVRQLRPADSIPLTGKAERSRPEKALDYSVGIQIQAPPETVWKVLTEAPAYTSWNSTVVRLDGDIRLGSTLQLVSKVAPERTFKLKVTTLTPPQHMVWEDGGSMFLGVRNFTLSPMEGGGTRFVMSETLSGGMLKMIEKSLPDFGPSFEAFAADLKKAAEARAAGASG